MAAREHHESKQPGSLAQGGQPQQRRHKTFNLWTYKFHSLRDYVSTIKQYGTTDSYTTAIVSFCRSHVLKGVLWQFIIGWAGTSDAKGKL